MSKIYSFGDVVKAYEGGYEGDFLMVDGYIRVQYGDKMTYTADHIPQEFIKADKKVDFNNAVEEFHNDKDVYSLLRGRKRIYSTKNGDNYCLVDQCGTAVCSAEILSGEWFIVIKDEE